VTYNAIVLAQLDPASADARIADITAHFRQDARSASWHIGPSSTPPELGARLAAHGWAFDGDEPGMAIDLAALPSDIDLPAGFTIESIEDLSSLSAWISTYYSQMPAELQRLHQNVLPQLGVGSNLPWRYYLGRLDGKAVATSELFMDAAVAGIQQVVTWPEARGRGIGTAMTLCALRDGRAHGCSLGVLTSSPQGIRIYERMGFRIYCRFSHYEWRPDERAANE
jgi:GNAT superfamily N-acetyltransferase